MNKHTLYALCGVSIDGGFPGLVEDFKQILSWKLSECKGLFS